MRRLISDICLLVLLPLWLFAVGVAHAQFNSFPPGAFLGHGARDPASGGGGGGIAFVNSAFLGYQGSGSTSTASYTVGSGSNRMLVVGGYASTTDTVTGATFNGVSMTLFDKAPQNGSGTNWLYGFYLLSPASGAHNVVITQSGSTQLGFTAGDYTGVTTGLDVHSNNSVNTGADTLLATTLTTTVPNDWIIMFESGYDSNADNLPPGAGTGATRRAFDTTFGANALFDSNGALSTGLNSVTTTRTPFSVGILHVTGAFAP